MPQRMPSQTFWNSALNKTPARADVSIIASAAMFIRPACWEMVEQSATKTMGVEIRIRE